MLSGRLFLLQDTQYLGALSIGGFIYKEWLGSHLDVA